MGSAALVSADGGGIVDRVKDPGSPDRANLLFEGVMYFLEGWVRSCFGPVASGELFGGDL